MPLPLSLLRTLQVADAPTSWQAIMAYAWATLSPPLPSAKASAEVVRRDKTIGEVDLFLATAGWDLWRHWYGSVPRTSDALAEWWEAQDSGRAVLILDGLSLREVPWILAGLQERGYTIHQAQATGSELPPETTPFAKALGFGTRSALENNGAGKSHRLPGAHTDRLDCEWSAAADQVLSQPRWVLWHEWPDSRIHGLAEHGKGISDLVAEAQQILASDGFWTLVERLTQGRRLVITSDHGYAAVGHFTDVTDTPQVMHLKEAFKAGRSCPDTGAESPWIPPIDLVLDTDHGRHRLVLGRRKWKVAGGNPTLAHGGLTVLEALVPFIEASRAEA